MFESAEGRRGRMGLMAYAHGAFTRVFRPISDLRGAGRFCKWINHAFLRGGLEPVHASRMRDGTRINIDLRSQTEWYALYSGRYDDAEIGLVLALLNHSRGASLMSGATSGCMPCA